MIVGVWFVSFGFVLPGSVCVLCCLVFSVVFAVFSVVFAFLSGVFELRVCVEC